MCTFIGHTILGSTIWLKQSTTASFKKGFVILSVLVLANLPDIDFLFGFFHGNPNLYHHDWTHSFFFSILIGCFVGLIFFFSGKPYWVRAGLVSSVIILSHVFIDFFTLDRNEVTGIQLFWPITKEYFISPIVFFGDVIRSSNNQTFFISLFCWHNLRTIFIEIGILGPFFF